MDILNTKPILQGEYKLQKILQKLPYSSVYLATSLHNPAKRWAVKEVSLNFDKPEEKKEMFLQFEKTARKYIALEHPLIVPLEDCFYENNFEYIIFEFIPGHRLQEIMDLRTKPFNEYQVMDLAWQIGNALDFLHSREIVFHDLNPSNIVITPDGSIKLTDYGLGKMLAKPEPGQPKWGSLGYGPPEQMGPDAIITPACDIYALGVVMHQLLTFWDPSLSKGVIPPVRKLNAEASEQIENIILSCTYNDPALRYASIRVCLKDLQKLMKIKPVVETPKETWLQKLARDISKPFKQE